jgi:hypothetical protein
MAAGGLYQGRYSKQHAGLWRCWVVARCLPSAASRFGLTTPSSRSP